MFGWFKKDSAPSNGPDFRSVDSPEKAQALARSGELQKMLLLPAEFGGEDVPPNWVLVPSWVAEKKAETDQNIVFPLAAEGKISSYRATPQYQGKSFVPNAITIEASDPESFSVTIAIWGDALEEDA
ncbi:MAG TPA: hypothetical protein VGD45_26930 [Steroidobacter sp.]|uniref:hypothetical protein n=1 Tax=Steroidobacter sp. TaxID=1978227 RepID=UPI002ED78ADE